MIIKIETIETRVECLHIESRKGRKWHSLQKRALILLSIHS
jgi:hypothetical protein